ncbi:cytochrome P450 [Sistotremastrum suecicum HHB10207 ss-3]|uniref:Cytochrome P450 n=1 Tax=Sistotremastrum suecicum HHB10207 ss-3 TaxID=1314776 RepID=A0A166BV09_9AGAM|nr:cytochrome P450 [Sistotremastrum suecicum HHB10207 ss-3]
MDATYTTWILAVLIAGLLYKLLARPQSHPPYPPGPKGIPILGNALQLPPNKIWATFAEWAPVYGDITGLTVLGMKMIILNTYEVATDLLDKRGFNYSDRPKFALASEHGEWEFALPMKSYGELFHTQRRYLNRFLTTSAVRNYHDFMVDHARVMGVQMLNKPEEFRRFTRMYTASNIMKMAYGYKVTSPDDEWIKRADNGVKSAEVFGTSAAHPIDIWPILGKLPYWVWGRDFIRKLNIMKAGAESVRHGPYFSVKDQVLSGTAVPSMTSTLIEEHLLPDGTVRDEDSLASIAATTYIAGADTTVSALDTFFLAMMLFPDAQRAAQREIDNVLHQERLPTLEDKDALPHIQAIMKEVIRWNPIIPTGLPHASMEDDEYKGLFIPAKSMIFVNVWGLVRDPKHYPSPDEFNPERYIDSSGPKPILRKDVQDPEDYTFGFGRRVCPGRHFATTGLWIAMATILTVFEISMPLDEDGNPITPTLEFGIGTVRHPGPFKCKLTPRSDNIKSLLTG